MVIKTNSVTNCGMHYLALYQPPFANRFIWVYMVLVLREVTKKEIIAIGLDKGFSPRDRFECQVSPGLDCVCCCPGIYKKSSRTLSHPIIPILMYIQAIHCDLFQNLCTRFNFERELSRGTFAHAAINLIIKVRFIETQWHSTRELLPTSHINPLTLVYLCGTNHESRKSKHLVSLLLSTTRSSKVFYGPHYAKTYISFPIM